MVRARSLDANLGATFQPAQAVYYFSHLYLSSLFA
jgi:hypothetical protein